MSTKRSRPIAAATEFSGRARRQSFYNLACALAIKGDKDAAFEALDQAFDNGYRDADGDERGCRSCEPSRRPALRRDRSRGCAPRPPIDRA